MTNKIVVLSTCASEDEAEQLARAMVEQRLAACVSVLPGVRSFYRWKGEIECAQEWLLLIKTSRELMGSLVAALQKVHTYEVPEALAVQVVDGATDYLAWLDSNLRGTND